MSTNEEVIKQKFDLISDGLIQLSAQLVSLKQDVIRLESGQAEYIGKLEKECDRMVTELAESVEKSDEEEETKTD